jgi:hypothetical protein
MKRRRVFRTVAACLVLAHAATGRLAAAQNGSVSGVPTGREVVNRHVEMIGGHAALMKLHSRHVWATFEIPGERIRGTIEIFAARPNKRVLRVTQTDAGTTITGFDGRTAWKKEPSKSAVAIRGRELAQVQDDAVYDLDLHADANVALLQNRGTVRWEGRECYELRVGSRSGREWTEYYDVATGLFAGSESRRETDKGQVTLRTVIAGYRSYDGVRLPSALSLRSGGVEQTIKVMRVRHNTVADAVFVPPPGVGEGRAIEATR